ncbi:MAG TPA: hypothetical protein VL426_05230 [Candidatus Binatia bacterium]|jgi:hypothetical protein|nr:hypothetical protein [Candidatus Binatia bacterium]
MTYVRNNPASFAAAKAAAGSWTPWYHDVRVLNSLLLAGIIAAFVGYLVVNDRAAQKGFAVRALEKRIAELEDRQQKLDLQVVAEQSMDAIDAKIQGLGLVPVAAVDYVVGGSGAVAVK